jgi:hypothetical protein
MRGMGLLPIFLLCSHRTRSSFEKLKGSEIQSNGAPEETLKTRKKGKGIKLNS